MNCRIVALAPELRDLAKTWQTVLWRVVVGFSNISKYQFRELEHPRIVRYSSAIFATNNALRYWDSFDMAKQIRATLVCSLIFSISLPACVQPPQPSSLDGVRPSIVAPKVVIYSVAEIAAYCKNSAPQIYEKCWSIARQVRTDRQLEWQIFQSLPLPIQEKKMRDESKKYYNAALITSRELALYANVAVTPKFRAPLYAGQKNLNDMFCFEGVNNYETRPREKRSADEISSVCINAMKRS